MNSYICLNQVYDYENRLTFPSISLPDISRLSVLTIYQLSNLRLPVSTHFSLFSKKISTMSQPTYTNKLSHFFSLLKRSIRGDWHDYTKSSIKVALILLPIPMILELSLESVFVVVEIFFVGKLRPNALATAGLTELAITIIYSVAI